MSPPSNIPVLITFPSAICVPNVTMKLDLNSFFFQRDIEEKYAELRELAERRRDALKDHKDLFEYFRECDEVSTWIKERESVAASEDYGTDLEHVQVGQGKAYLFLVISVVRWFEFGCCLVRMLKRETLDVESFEYCELHNLPIHS